MKQHKDIREILKRSGTAPTGICGFWRSAASFAAVLFGAFAAFKFLAGIHRISMFFLAHIGPPAALFQLRSFDVPLMIFVSGLSYSGRQVVGYASFVRKRLGRLLIPLYFFLTVYFLVM